MAVKVAEYLGHNAEVPGATVTPVSAIQPCPFTDGAPCKKLANDKKPPVCSVRKVARGHAGTLWITCSKRLCASQHNISLSSYQSDMLFAIAKLLFGSGVSKSDVLIKSEEPIAFKEVAAKPYRADFTMQLKPPAESSINGKRKFIVEIQGGGETSNTGKLTAQIEKWADAPSRTNADLTESVKDVGTLETNAWRRQQEQLLVKGSAAKATKGECGMALCVGEALFEYIIKKLGKRKLDPFTENPPKEEWSLAIIPIIEAKDTDPEAIYIGDSLALKPDREKVLYMDFDHFVNLLGTQGGKSSEAFKGNCLDLNGSQVQVG